MCGQLYNVQATGHLRSVARHLMVCRTRARQRRWAYAHDRMIPADIRACSLVIMSPTPKSLCNIANTSDFDVNLNLLGPALALKFRPHFHGQRTWRLPSRV
ncbi:hypothetical protein PoB_006115400 [Plakobranchus ocellatus]|uniref:Uncharacterized protein n=1 Tax=Plakobranchus ocellatus TaxID=259542 RepID=A0AAV4CS36_9GAST|nr:hypothetical protein PoB_006115400 [Plakobranchus ocellatus]